MDKGAAVIGELGRSSVVERLAVNEDVGGSSPSVSATPAYGQWQPIETQPKKGMYLIANAKMEVCPVQWGHETHHGIVQNCVGFNDWTFGEPATHWQPLPAPPVDTAARGTAPNPSDEELSGSGCPTGHKEADHG